MDPLIPYLRTAVHHARIKLNLTLAYEWDETLQFREVFAFFTSTHPVSQGLGSESLTICSI